MLTATHRLQSGLAAVVWFVLALVNVAPGAALAAPPDSTADVVYGQLGSFTTANVNAGGLSASSLAAPDGVALDGSGGLYIADTNNQRVLFYPAGSTTATYDAPGPMRPNRSIAPPATRAPIAIGSLGPIRSASRPATGESASMMALTGSRAAPAVSAL